MFKKYTHYTLIHLPHVLAFRQTQNCRAFDASCVPLARLSSQCCSLFRTARSTNGTRYSRCPVRRRAVSIFHRREGTCTKSSSKRRHREPQHHHYHHHHRRRRRGRCRSRHRRCRRSVPRSPAKVCFTRAMNIVCLMHISICGLWCVCLCARAFVPHHQRLSSGRRTNLRCALRACHIPHTEHITHVPYVSLISFSPPLFELEQQQQQFSDDERIYVIVGTYTVLHTSPMQLLLKQQQLQPYSIHPERWPISTIVIIIWATRVCDEMGWAEWWADVRAA